MQLPRRSFLLTLGGLLFLPVLFLLPGQGLATDSPMEAIRSTTNQVVQVFKAPENQGPHLREQRIKQVSEIVRPLFDRREVARRTLGVYWRDRTEEQRAEFIELFTELVEKTYGETFDQRVQKHLDTLEFFSTRRRLTGILPKSTPAFSFLLRRSVFRSITVCIRLRGSGSFTMW